MRESLDLATAKEFLARALKPVGKSSGHAGAAVAAVPLGFVEWFMTTDGIAGMADFYRRDHVREILGPETSERKAREWDEFLARKPSLCDYIAGRYRELRHPTLYKPQSDLTHS